MAVGTRKSQSKEKDELLVSTGSSSSEPRMLKSLLIDGKDTMKGATRVEPSEKKVYRWHGAMYAITEDTPQEWIDQESERYKKKSAAEETTLQPTATASSDSRKRRRDTNDSDNERPYIPRKRWRSNLPASDEPPPSPESQRRSFSNAPTTKKPRRQSVRPAEQDANSVEHDEGTLQFDIPKSTDSHTETRVNLAGTNAEGADLQPDNLDEAGDIPKVQTPPVLPNTPAATPKTRAVGDGPSPSAPPASVDISQAEVGSFAYSIVKIAKINSRIATLQTRLNIDTLKLALMKDLRRKMMRANHVEKRAALKRAMQARSGIEQEGDAEVGAGVEAEAPSVTILGSSKWDTTDLDTNESDVVAELLNQTGESLGSQSAAGDDSEQEDDDTPPSNTPPPLTRDGTTQSPAMSSHSPPTSTIPRPPPSKSAAAPPLPTTNRGGQSLRWSLQLSNQLRNPDRAESAIRRGRLEGESKSQRRRRVKREIQWVKSLPVGGEGEDEVNPV